MDRSYPYSRRLLSRTRLHKRIAAVAAVGMLGATGAFMLVWKPDPIAAAVQPSAAPLLALADAPQSVHGLRRIYPYSVVPGGVASKTELARVVRTDRVVATHYAGFDVDKAHPVVVEKPRAVHVSYRKGGQVYWTAHKVMLAKGETLLSDGRNEMRARCANRISDLPQYPVEAHRPAMAELDEAVELDEGEEYAFGPDGLPVSTTADGIPRHTGQRSIYGGGSGSGRIVAPAAAPGDTMLASSAYSPGTGIGSPAGMYGSSSSLGGRPLPLSAPTPSTTTPGTSGGDSGSSSGPQPGLDLGSDPVPLPGTGTDVVTLPSGPQTGDPQPVPTPPVASGPGATPVPDPAPGIPPATNPGTGPLPVFTPDPAPQPGSPLPPTRPGQLPPEVQPQVPPVPPGTGPLFPLPGPETDPLIPKPPLTPTPPLNNSEEDPKAPADVPEPGSTWLLGGALASMLALRRRPPGRLFRQGS